jgi:hypothetical protein
MKKNTFYFPHDMNTISDPKISAFVGVFGGAGYGVFWRIVEMLHEDKNNKLPLKKYIFSAIAGTLKLNVDEVVEMVKFLTDEFEIFETDGEFFYSKRVCENMEKRNEIKEKRSFAGRVSAEKRSNESTNVEHVMNTDEQNPTKEIKGNEIKIKDKEPTIHFDKLLIYFNQIFEKNCRVIPDAVKRSYIARLREGFTTDEIKQSILNVKNDPFHIENAFKYATIEYFSRSKTLNSYGYKTKNDSKKYVPTK